MSDIAILSTLKTAYDLAHSLLKERDARIISEKIVELNAIIFSAQESALAANNAQFALVDRVRDLEKQVADLKAWNTKKEDYKLVPWKKGVSAYVAKDCMKPTEEIHALCATCFNKGQEAILQFVNVMGGISVVKCQNCGSHC